MGQEESEVRPGRFFYCTDMRSYASSSYDGGCGGIETDRFGLWLDLYPDPESFSPENGCEERLAKLEKPLGLADSVLIWREYR